MRKTMILVVMKSDIWWWQGEPHAMSSQNYEQKLRNFLTIFTSQKAMHATRHSERKKNKTEIL